MPAKIPKRVEELRKSVFNPRRITEQAREGLRRSLFIFGDLSGFVWNEETGNIVCGHQRQDTIDKRALSEIAWGEEYAVELGEEDKRFQSKERDGWITTGDGARFRIRRVKWPIAFEKAANVAANDMRIQGEFDYEALDEVVKDIALEMPSLSEAFNFPALTEVIGPEHEPDRIPPVGIKVDKPPEMTWILIGIPIERYKEISDKIDQIAKIKDIVCEVAATNE